MVPDHVEAGAAAAAETGRSARARRRRRPAGPIRKVRRRTGDPALPRPKCPAALKMSPSRSPPMLRLCRLPPAASESRPSPSLPGPRLLHDRDAVIVRAPGVLAVAASVPGHGPGRRDQRTRTSASSSPREGESQSRSPQFCGLVV